MLPDYFFISDVTWRESLAHDFLRLEIRVLCQLVLWYRLKLSMLYGQGYPFSSPNTTDCSVSDDFNLFLNSFPLYQEKKNVCHKLGPHDYENTVCISIHFRNMAKSSSKTFCGHLVKHPSWDIIK